MMITNWEQAEAEMVEYAVLAAVLRGAEADLASKLAEVREELQPHIERAEAELESSRQILEAWAVSQKLDQATPRSRYYSGVTIGFEKSKPSVQLPRGRRAQDSLMLWLLARPRFRQIFTRVTYEFNREAMRETLLRGRKRLMNVLRERGIKLHQADQFYVRVFGK
jgi:hypothetical protein